MFFCRLWDFPNVPKCKAKKAKEAEKARLFYTRFFQNLLCSGAILMCWNENGTPTNTKSHSMDHNGFAKLPSECFYYRTLLFTQ